MSVTTSPIKRRSDIVGAEQLQQYSVGSEQLSDLVKERFESSTLGVKANYSTFSGSNNNYAYLHGFSQNGATPDGSLLAADVNGFFYYNASKVSIAKGYFKTSVPSVEGYILYDPTQDLDQRTSVNTITIADGSAHPRICFAYVGDKYDTDTPGITAQDAESGLWFYDNSSAGVGTAFTPLATDLAIGYIKTGGSSITQIALFRNPLPINEVVTRAHNILADSIGTNHLQFQSVVGDSVDALSVGTKVLTADITFTGELYSPNDSGARIEIIGSPLGDVNATPTKSFVGIRAYDQVELKTFNLNALTGDVEITGGLFSSGTVQGGAIDIGASAEDADATPTFHVDSQGNMWSGGSKNDTTGPFYVSNLGEVTASNIKITGANKASGNIIETNSFVVDKDGDVTANSITVNGGQIGGTVIDPATPNTLKGGIIEGAQFKIENSGSINFSGSGTMEWTPDATGGIIVSNDGYIKSSNFDSGAKEGWQLSGDGAEIYTTFEALNITITNGNQNYLVNSALEDGYRGFDQFGDELPLESGQEIASWSRYNETNTEFKITAETSRYFSKSLKITGQSGAISEYVGIYQDVTLPETYATGEPFWITCWGIKETGTNRDMQMWIYPHGSSSNGYVTELTSDQAPVTLVGSNWTRYAYKWEVPAATSVDKLRIYIVIKDIADGDSFYLDAVQLEHSSFPTDYQPAPLELPDNYIQSAFISDLTADKISSGTISTETLTIDGDGRIQSNNFGPTPSASDSGYILTADKLIMQNAGLQIVGADGILSFTDDTFKIEYGGVKRLNANASGLTLADTIQVTDDAIQSSGFTAAAGETAPSGWQIKNDGNAQFGGDVIVSGTIQASQYLGLNTVTSGSGNSLRSANYSAGSAGWAFFGDGSAELQNILARGDVVANTLTLEPTNLVTNGDFADNDLSFWNDNSNASITYVSSGTNYMRIVETAPGSDAWAVSDTITIDAQNAYRLIYTAEAPSATQRPNASVYIDWNDGAGLQEVVGETFYNYQTVAGQPAFAPTTIDSGSIRPPSASTSAEIYIEVLEGIEGKIYNIQFEAVPNIDAGLVSTNSASIGEKVLRVDTSEALYYGTGIKIDSAEKVSWGKPGHIIAYNAQDSTTSHNYQGLEIAAPSTSSLDAVPSQDTAFIELRSMSDADVGGPTFYSQIRLHADDVLIQTKDELGLITPLIYSTNPVDGQSDPGLVPHYEVSGWGTATLVDLPTNDDEYFYITLPSGGFKNGLLYFEVTPTMAQSDDIALFPMPLTNSTKATLKFKVWQISGGGSASIQYYKTNHSVMYRAIGW